MPAKACEKLVEGYPKHLKMTGYGKRTTYLK